MVEGQQIYKSTKNKNVQSWPRTFLQACTGNFWYIHEPTCLLTELKGFIFYFLYIIPLEKLCKKVLYNNREVSPIWTRRPDILKIDNL